MVVLGGVQYCYHRADISHFYLQQILLQTLLLIKHSVVDEMNYCFAVLKYLKLMVPSDKTMGHGVLNITSFITDIITPWYATFAG